MKITFDYSASYRQITHNADYYQQFTFQLVTLGPHGSLTSKTVQVFDNPASVANKSGTYFTDLYDFVPNSFGSRDTGDFLPSGTTMHVLDVNHAETFELRLALSSPVPDAPDIDAYVEDTYIADRNGDFFAFPPWSTEFEDDIASYFDAAGDWYDGLSALGVNSAAFADSGGDVGIITANEPLTVGTLPDSVELFLADAVVIGSTLDDIIETYTGKDKLTGGKGDNSLSAGIGNDELHGEDKTGKDVLRGGAGNDKLFGDKLDTAVFEGNIELRSGGIAASQYAVSYLGPHTGSAKPVPLFEVAGPDGQDKVDGVRFAHFDNNTVPLVDWYFEVERGQDGTATISFYENGKLLYSQAAFYDDTTPIAADPGGETFNLIYRTNSHVGLPPGAPPTTRLWEFANSDGSSTVAGRENIAIHGGVSPANSEGCIVADRKAFIGKVRDLMEKALAAAGTVEDHFAGRDFYNLPVPITVTVTDVDGAVDQPIVNFDPFDGGDIGETVTTQLTLTGDGNDPGLTKDLRIYFRVKGGDPSHITLGGAAHQQGNHWYVDIAHGNSLSGGITALINTADAETLKLEVYRITIQAPGKKAYVDIHHLLGTDSVKLDINGGALHGMHGDALAQVSSPHWGADLPDAAALWTDTPLM